jgi:hypothetical protein
MLFNVFTHYPPPPPPAGNGSNLCPTGNSSTTTPLEIAASRKRRAQGPPTNCQCLCITKARQMTIPLATESPLLLPHPGKWTQGPAVTKVTLAATESKKRCAQKQKSGYCTHCTSTLGYEPSFPNRQNTVKTEQPVV